MIFRVSNRACFCFDTITAKSVDSQSQQTPIVRRVLCIFYISRAYLKHAQKTASFTVRTTGSYPKHDKVLGLPEVLNFTQLHSRTPEHGAVQSLPERLHFTQRTFLNLISRFYAMLVVQQKEHIVVIKNNDL